MMIENGSLPCPACGFLTLEGAYGSYVICQICGWEDDQLQLANPASSGGANAESLLEAQKVALERYPLDIEIAKGLRRDPRWRPLSEAEKKRAEQDRLEAHWNNTGILDVTACYWMRPFDIGNNGRS